MDIMDIITNAISYPIENLKALLIYLVLGLVLGLVMGITGVGTVLSSETSTLMAFIVAVIGVIIAILISFLIQGYGLDIIKLGIRRSNASPEIDFQRQVTNGVKLFVVSVVYLIIPVVITALLSLIFRDWIISIIGVILFVLFYFALAMGQCRLAKSEDLSIALDVQSAIDDLFNIGVLKVIITVILVMLIMLIINTIFGLIFEVIFNEAIVSALMGVINVYLTFFSYRAMGLLYSEI
ncbi:MAG: DUF4013 domain-containing protein [Methanosphaera sp.]|nr:DUF4013 domain-containing protein [Methanosphaera sp.]